MNFQHKFALAHMIKPVPDDVFTKWPLHITIVPWFHCHQDLEDSVAKLMKTIEKIEPFEIAIGNDAMFGPDKDVPVKLIDYSKELKKLHATIYHTILVNGCDVEQDEYTTQNYTPHVTVRGDRNIKTGTKVLVDSIDMIENIEDGKMGRKAVKHFNFLRGKI